MQSYEVLQQVAPGHLQKLSVASSLILRHGWAASTVRHYAAAVNKYFLFAKEANRASFPATTESIYEFICWCKDGGKDTTVRAGTTKKYLTGLRMWHVLHDTTFPTVNEHRIRLLLKASKKVEVEQPSNRMGFTLSDIHRMVKNLNEHDHQHMVLRGVILVGFWGLARLGELTMSTDHPDVFIRRKDVRFDKDMTHATIRVRLAKTAAPGESQYLRLSKQPNTLDPIAAITSLLDTSNWSADDPLFPSHDGRRPISRSRVMAHIKSFNPPGNASWSGHSLRIGGASLRAHYGGSVKSIQRAGRWKSTCYQLYVRKYDKKTAKGTSLLARRLNHKLK